MRDLIDENMSSSRLAVRLRTAGHDVELATDVGLVSVSDARVLAWAVIEETSRFCSSFEKKPSCWISGNAAAARSSRSRATPMLVGCAARMASSASMPSAGEIGSSALNVSARATPMSAHWPQLIVVAGSHDARSQSTRPSSQALAAA